MIASAALLVFSLLTTPAAHADGHDVHARQSSPYRLDWHISLPVSVGALALHGLLEGAVKPTLTSRLDCPLAADGLHCDARRLWRGDKTSVGRQSRSWRHITDIGQVVVPVVAVLSLVGDAWLMAGAGPRRWAPALTDFGVALEATSVAVLTTTTLKYAVRRPRPTQYGAHPISSVEGSLSFPSGHTSLAAAVLASAATTATLRHPHGWVPPTLWGVAAAGTATMAAGRILAGRHFVTDVVAGGVVGAVAGIAVPLLHRKTWMLAPSFGPHGQTGLSASGAF